MLPLPYLHGPRYFQSLWTTFGCDTHLSRSIIHSWACAIMALAVYLLCAVITCIAYSCFSTISTSRRHAATARKLGCEPAPFERWPDPFALVNLIRTIWAFRNRRILEYMRGTFDDTTAKKTVYTYETKILGDRVLFTCDPRNIQAILATQFKDFELGQVRRGSFAPL